MDVESPEHLERLRDQPEIKAALLRLQPAWPTSEARFERVAKNTLYWPLIDSLAARFVAAGQAAPVQEKHEIYGRPCWLLAVPLSPAADAPFTIAIAAAEGASTEALVTVLETVTRNYWFGSSFFK